tara:strand:+ start:934 stop:1251 length:318 start_codon:yes stop_codon:yes gene_type:complete
MDHELANPLILKSNHVFFTILEQRAFVQERTTLKHFTISVGQDSHHEVQQKNVDQKEMEDHDTCIDILLFAHALVRVSTKHVVELSLKAHQRIFIWVWINILQPR